MTVKIAGCWDLAWCAPLTEYDYLWDSLRSHFQVTGVYMTPVSGISREGLIEVASIEDVIAANPDLTPVMIDERAPVALQDFEHPADALYITGRTGYSPYSSLGWEGSAVRVGTEAEPGLLQPHQALGMVLYDRSAKSWR